MEGREKNEHLRQGEKQGGRGAGEGRKGCWRQGEDSGSTGSGQAQALTRIARGKARGRGQGGRLPEGGIYLAVLLRSCLGMGCLEVPVYIGVAVYPTYQLGVHAVLPSSSCRPPCNQHSQPPHTHPPALLPAVPLPPPTTSSPGTRTHMHPLYHQRRRRRGTRSHAETARRLKPSLFTSSSLPASPSCAVTQLKSLSISSLGKLPLHRASLSPFPLSRVWCL